MNKKECKGINLLQEVAEIVDSGRVAEFFNEAACAQWFFDKQYPDGPVCPYCGAPIANEQARQSFLAFARFKCGSCGRQATARTGTILEGAKLSVREFYVLCLYLGWGADDIKVSRVLGLNVFTVKAWRDKLQLMAETNTSGRDRHHVKP